jgi:hypothetical protein
MRSVEWDKPFGGHGRSHLSDTGAGHLHGMPMPVPVRQVVVIGLNFLG